MSKCSITLGALEPSIAEQLAAQGLQQTGKDVAMLDRLAKAVTLAHIHGILTDSECTKARKRIVRELKVSRGASR